MRKIKFAFTRLVKPLARIWTRAKAFWLGCTRNPRKPSFASAHSYGFTLAEVLITLTILGVVAAIAVPNLIRSYKMKAVETQLKKSFSDLDNALSMACAENNTDLSHLLTKAFEQDDPGKYFASNYIEPYYRKISKKTYGSDSDASNIFVGKGGYWNEIKDLQGEYVYSNPNYGRTGYWIQYAAPNSSFLGVYANSKPVITFIMDVNGLKEPNQVGYDIFYFSAIASQPFELNAGEFNSSIFNQLICGVRPYKDKIVHTRKCDGNGENCSCVIQKNNWKFPKDYPAKF